MDLCVYESEEYEYGVGAGVNTTLLSDTLQSIGLVESAATSRAMVLVPSTCVHRGAAGSSHEI